MLACTLLLASCVEEQAPSAAPDEEQVAQYEVLDTDLQVLKDEFNANEGRVRLLFLSGPTCGICLRGMADLNDAFLAERQNDDRLVTFVVHVPTLGAREDHVAETIPLLQGPRIHHYWEDSGIIGQHYTEVMDVFMYVWDFWAIYGPDARWEGTLPPKPDYFEHQLGSTSGRSRGFPKELVLDASRFAEKAMEYADGVDTNRFANEAGPSANEASQLADGTEIPFVAQPRNVAVRQHIIGRGGYANLKRIQGIQAKGTLEAGGQTYSLSVTTRRPNTMRRELSLGDRSSVAETRNNAAVVDEVMNRGLPKESEAMLLESFEFDGMFVEWPDKGHEVSMSGMRKFGDVLAWRLRLEQKDGPTWNMFIDSHSGDLVNMELLADEGVRLSIRQSDFRDVSGFRFPHQIEYRGDDGVVLARESINSITLDIDTFNIEDEAVSH